MITVKTNCPSSNDGNTWLSKTSRRILQPKFLIIIFFVGLTSQQLASADPLDNLNFDSSPTITLNDNGLFDVAEETLATLQGGTPGDNDCAEKGHGPISVTVKSTRSGIVVDTISLQAIEIDDPTVGVRNPTANTCIFGNTFLYFSPDDQRFKITDIVTITQKDTSGGRTTDNTITTINVPVTSTTSSAGITLTLTETSPNSGIFKGTLVFTRGPSAGNALKVSDGDIITATYNGKKSYGQITPSPNGSAGLLRADVGDTITASYGAISGSTDINVGGGGGGGGGGLVRPGLVVDAIIPKAGGGPASQDSSPPSFTFDMSSIVNLSLPDNIKTSILNHDPFKPIMPLSDNLADFPLSIDGKGFALSSYANTIVTNIEETGKPIPLKLHFNEESGIQHVALYTNFPGASGEIPQSDTYIIYEKSKPTEISDPHGLFSNVKLATTKNGTKYEFLYNITFAKPMKKSDIILRIWDEKRNSQDIKIFDAWEVSEPQNKTSQIETVPAKKIENKTVLVITSSENVSDNLQKENQDDLMSYIKKWGGYSSESISDSELLSEAGIKGQHIPSWFMKTTRWLVSNDTSQKEFLDALKYLYEIKVIT